MSSLEIANRHGFVTVLSAGPESPAAPYVREYHPQTLEEMQRIGIIPKHIPLDHLKHARDEALGRVAKVGVLIEPPALAAATEFPQAERYAHAVAASRRREAVADAMTTALTSRHEYTSDEAKILAQKTLALEASLTDRMGVSVWRQIEVAEDLLVHSPVLVDRTIQGLVARDVVIFKQGTLVVDGSYLLIRCRSLAGESSWWTKVRSVEKAFQSTHIVPIMK
jgi:hypothetical protein